ncbi:MAG: sugar ABC transporter ATP-binding protein [Clostridia bacterium]
MEATTDIILRAEHISKAFVGVQALDAVDVAIRKGRIHCLAGENGSGKSTFVKAVSGVYQPDAGNIVLNGTAYGHLTPSQAMKEGVQVIYQDLSLFQHMTVGENIAINTLRKEGKKLVNWAQVYKIAKAQTDRIGVTLDLSATIMETSMANRQLTAICRALAQDAKLLFMDEPTTALTKSEVQNLLKVVLELKAKGLAIVFISHKLDEVFEIADEITIFRDGRKVGDFPSSALNEQKLAYHMTGRDVQYPCYRRTCASEETLLEVKGLTKPGNYEDISFSMRPGDILGLTGLLGSGRTELALSLFGLNPPTSGTILFEGAPVRIPSPSAARQLGIALLPEDRATQGLFKERSIRENLTSAMVDRLTRGLGFLDTKREMQLAQAGVSRLRVRTPSVETTIGSLSGGNQQKGVVAKWINLSPKLFIMDSPTVGVDIGSKAEIYELIQAFAAEGMAILFITDELEELMTNCNRVLIMANKRQVAVLEEAELAQGDARARIAQAIRGAYDQAKERCAQ